MLNDRMIKDMWKEVVITKFKVLSWNLPGETDKKTLSNYDWSPG
jgi:hypothetical protein